MPCHRGYRARTHFGKSDSKSSTANKEERTVEMSTAYQIARRGLPRDWAERTPSELSVKLPVGATYYVTPGHGYLEVDTRILTAKVSEFDYLNGAFAYLEEDCSLAMWLAENGLIPMEPYIEAMIGRIQRIDTGKKA